MDRPTDTRAHILDTAEGLILGKGFSAVGLGPILAAAGVPKGSFYHWFPSKEAFGVALLERYFANYLEQLDQQFGATNGTGRARVLGYFAEWMDRHRDGGACAQQCLAVKLAAEVADLSEPMRRALETGTQRITARIAAALESARLDGSLPGGLEPASLAVTLYALWIGASVLAKAQHSAQPFEAAWHHTLHLLGADAL
ncbi:TetR/AcrR family transcriptional regulator [Niveibacterium umoris]|uniref:TetR/AcrR family transcriptional repressor of nem operon n=1 Tax=Niveibacterium umoris TaxID=1193620 RepID=A0A840BSL9_9RHOO|nr:TetR/AcrR family transcriptional regulator [Niveibacterium umoris]MBB4013357.1 TetR/AcrR family transcriptional repressor of nem operon [Niveibacterium umoris]